MIRRLPPSALVHLPTAALLVVAAAIWIGPWGTSAAANTDPGRADAPVPQADPAALADLVAARPLFDASRRPVASASVDTPAPQTAQPVRFDLVGVLEDGRDYIAILRGSDGSGLRQARLGEDVAGNRIVSITRGGVTFRDADGQDAFLPLAR